MSACSVLARTHCCCFPKVGTKVVTTEEWPGTAAGVVSGPCSLLKQCRQFYLR